MDLAGDGESSRTEYKISPYLTGDRVMGMGRDKPTA